MPQLYKPHFQQINTMKKKDRLVLKLEKLLKEFEDGHRKLKYIKLEMVKLRKEIKETPNLSEERPDEELMKDAG